MLPPLPSLKPAAMVPSLPLRSDVDDLIDGVFGGGAAAAAEEEDMATMLAEMCDLHDDMAYSLREQERQQRLGGGGGGPAAAAVEREQVMREMRALAGEIASLQEKLHRRPDQGDAELMARADGAAVRTYGRSTSNSVVEAAASRAVADWSAGNGGAGAGGGSRALGRSVSTGSCTLVHSTSIAPGSTDGGSSQAARPTTSGDGSKSRGWGARRRVISVVEQQHAALRQQQLRRTLSTAAQSSRESAAAAAAAAAAAEEQRAEFLARECAALRGVLALEGLEVDERVLLRALAQGGDAALTDLAISLPGAANLKQPPPPAKVKTPRAAPSPAATSTRVMPLQPPPRPAWDAPPAHDKERAEPRKTPPKKSKCSIM